MRGESSAFLRYPVSGSEDRLRSRRAEAHDDAGPEQPDLGFEPRPAGTNLRRVRLFMQPPFAPFLELEMFHRVGDVDGRTVDAGIGKGTVEQASRGSDKRAAGTVFLVTRLLADEHRGSRRRTLAENRLFRVPVQVASPAQLNRVAENRKRLPVRQELSRARYLRFFQRCRKKTMFSSKCVRKPGLLIALDWVTGGHIGRRTPDGADSPNRCCTPNGSGAPDRTRAPNGAGTPDRSRTPDSTVTPDSAGTPGA